MAAATAVYMRETFHGFVATSIDAAYLVEAAVLANPRILPLLPRIPSSEYELASLIRPGNVIVCPLWGHQRWADGRIWAPSRVLGNGFTFYREITDDPDLQMTQEDLARERMNAQALAPFLGNQVGREGSLKGGLIKKIIRFALGGQIYILVAYYTMEYLRYLVRPRSQMVVGQLLLAQGVSQEFWDQPNLGGQRVRMRDDQNQGTVFDWAVWHNASSVEPWSYRGVRG